MAQITKKCKVDVMSELLQHETKDLTEQEVHFKSYKHYLQRKFIT